jgi:GNAT superfamily N-acetyltransferase
MCAKHTRRERSAKVAAVRAPTSDGAYSIEIVTAADLDELLPLMCAYCDFYRVAPAREALLDLSRALLADPELEGLQLIAREEGARAVGFATIFWSWSTLSASRIGTMHDLYVAPEARGAGLADRLIRACVERCAGRGASALEWQTAPDNLRAQAVYDRVGGIRVDLIDYGLEVPGGSVEGSQGRELD